MSKYFGEQISPILAEIADSLWEIDAREYQEPYEYADRVLADASKIFMSVCMDTFWKLAETEKWSLDERSERAQAMGQDLRDFIKKHLGIDSHDFYKGDKQ